MKKQRIYLTRGERRWRARASIEAARDHRLIETCTTNAIAASRARKNRKAEEMPMNKGLLAPRNSHLVAAARCARANFVAVRRGTARPRGAIHHSEKIFAQRRFEGARRPESDQKPRESLEVIRAIRCRAARLGARGSVPQGVLVTRP
jgi:hypothetical protein